MKLMFIHFGSHDSNISYFDGEKLHYIKTERYTGVKHHAWWNLWEFAYDLKENWNIDVNDIDEIYTTLSEDQFPEANTSGKQLELISKYTKMNSFPERNYIIGTNAFKQKIKYVHHHYCHALSAWMLEETPDIQFVIDGADQDTKLPSAAQFHVFKDDKILDYGLINGNSSIGLQLETTVSDVLDISSKVRLDNSGKVMGLQSYGQVDQAFLEFLLQFDMQNIENVFDLNNWYRYNNSDNHIAELTKLNWVTTVHEAIGEILLRFFKKHANKYDKIVYSGGVAQNVIWNTKLKNYFPNLVIPPHCGDEGLSLGGIEYMRRKFQLPKFNIPNFPYYQKDEGTDIPSDETIKKAAKLLAEGVPIGWYQGNGEIGPRALGNRSILINPTRVDAKEIANNIKSRERYRPFGASVLEEYATQYFDIAFPTPYMLYTAEVKNKQLLNSITHVDGTCRIQTVGDENMVYRKLLEEFYKLTNCPILLNTSLNVNGNGIAGTKKEALKIVYENQTLSNLFIGNEHIQYNFRNII